MGEYRHRSTLEVPAGDVFAWHARPGAFERLAPPWERLRVLEREGGIRDGGRLLLQMRRGPLRLHWEALHEGFEEGRRFRDVQRRGPFARWVHDHLMLRDGESRCRLEDRVEYRLPLEPLSRWIAGRSMRRSLERLFHFRHRRTRDDLLRHRSVPGSGPLRVAVSGASGMVGSALGAFLESGGHELWRLVRGQGDPAEREIRWDPARGTLEAAALEGLDAVVHLAGENVGAGRWTPVRKRAIRESRVRGTRLLAETLAGLERPPRVLVSASAIGYYGDRGEETLGESSPRGEGFLAEVAREWEEATGPAARAGIRVVQLRIGVVLAASGGALQRLLLPFRLGLGGPVGRGRQWMSWIALDDLVGVIHHALLDEGLSGPVNTVAPSPVTNAAFTRELARALRRPAFLPLPAPIVRLAFGEMGEALLLASTRVLPRRLQEADFSFLTPDLPSALRAELGLAPD